VATDQIQIRLLARHAQLVRALREAHIKTVARAGSRARLPELQLLAGEQAAARSNRARVGHALREARLRAKQPHVATETAQSAAKPKTRRSRAGLLFLAAALTLVALGPREA